MAGNAQRKTEAERAFPCNTPECDGKIGATSVTGLCTKCYASLYNWLKKKSATERLKRAQQLKLWESRLDFLLSDKQREDLQAQSHRQSYRPLPVLPGKVKAYRRRSKYKVMNGNNK